MRRIIDAYGRPLEDLRVLVTPECNLDCYFCHMEGSGLKGPLRPGEAGPKGIEVMTAGDYLVLAEAARRIGVKYFRVSGGEPLVRRDICDVLASLSSTGIPVGVTTNGVLLPRFADCLASLGIDKVNVSLHSLNPEDYAKITGRPMFRLALDGVKAALDAGLRVKVNFVLLRGRNEGDVKLLVDLAAKMGFEVQLIELHPVGRGADRMNEHLPPEEVLRGMGYAIARVEPGRIHNRRVLVLDNGVRVTIVDPVENPLFCAGCTRVRVRWDGGIIPCINWRGEPPISILPAIRSAGSFEDAVEGVIKSLSLANRYRRPYYLFGPAIEQALDGRLPRGLWPDRRSLRLLHPSVNFK